MDVTGPESREPRAAPREGGRVSGDSSAPPTRVGHYTISAVLGAGFVTNVYRAEAEGTGRLVVLKVLRTTAGRESAFFRRFEREARLLSALRHPNLIELFDYDAGVVGERPPYIVLEHVEGATLRQVLERTPRLEPDEAGAIALEIARALAYAHAHDIVHRDVKPANVLIGRSAHRKDGAPTTPLSAQRDPVNVKLVDFGVARDRGAAPDADSEGEGAIGTPAYMSPEQLLGEAIDHRSDQFALGIVLYQMLAGARPFDGDDGRPAIQRIRRDPPRPFKSHGLAVPRALERIVLRALSKRPADRFETTDELVTELATFLESRVDSIADLSSFHRRVLARAGVFDQRRKERDGLTEEAPAIRPLSARAAPIRVRAVPLTPTLLGLLAALAALVGGGAVIQWRLGGIREQEAPRAVASVSAESLETARIRVLVRPWAEVFVDGKRIDTTPLSRAIAVRPGRHIVMLQHPSATERRMVDVVAGQTLTLDVTLPVPLPSNADEFLPPSTSATPSVSATVKPPAPTVPSTLQNAPSP